MPRSKNRQRHYQVQLRYRNPAGEWQPWYIVATYSTKQAAMRRFNALVDIPGLFSKEQHRVIDLQRISYPFCVRAFHEYVRPY